MSYLSPLLVAPLASTLEDIPRAARLPVAHPRYLYSTLSLIIHISLPFVLLIVRPDPVLGSTTVTNLLCFQPSLFTRIIGYS